MEKLQLRLPDMYADHHVLKVRTVLAALPGINNVVASSAFQMVALEFDPQTTSAAAVQDALAAAGYTTAETGEARILTLPIDKGRPDPAWDRLGMRVTRTDSRDAKASR